MFNILALPGDGIGSEVLEQAIRVLEVLKDKYSLEYTIKEGLIGGCAVDETGDPFPQETQDLLPNTDIVLLGAVGGPKYDGLPKEKRPESGLLRIRKALGLYANLRPVKAWPQLLDQSPLKNERIQGVDLLIVRELISGAYFGARGHMENDGEIKAFDTIEYSSSEIRRIVKKGFELAEKRKCRLTSVDKANVLDTSRLWRKIVSEESKNYPSVIVNDMYVDNCAMQICLNPAQFDVVVTENMFGDILSDEASVLGGSLGMLPSASIGEGASLYEPAHGSAPDIAGQDKANPLATILSIAMMLRFDMNNADAAKSLETAVDRVLTKGLRTADIYVDGTELIGTKAMGDAVITELNRM